jgi:hypothetical protein
MDKTTFDYLAPNPEQTEKMKRLREAAKAYNDVIEKELEDGPDRDHAIRNNRETAMWANVAVTRRHDGSPR